MSKVTINGVDLELDLMDADVVEKFEDLNKWIVKKIQDPNAYEGLSTADGMRCGRLEFICLRNFSRR